MESESLKQCVSCGNRYHGNYCNHCGEKALAVEDKSLLSFLFQLGNEFTSADSRLWLTIKTIVFKPGQLSRDQMRGKRVQYMRPLTLFFVANLIYFLFPVYETFNTSLEIHMDQPYSELINVNERVDDKKLYLDLDASIFEAKFNEASSANSKILLILLVPLILPFFAIVGFAKRKNWVNHVNLSIEYWIFFLIVNVIVMGYAVYALTYLLTLVGIPLNFLNEITISLLIAVVSFCYLFFAVKRFYGYSPIISSVIALILVLSSLLVIFFYRFILFEITIRTL